MLTSVVLLFLVVGALIAIVGFYMIAAAAYREHLVWGLIAVFAPLGGLICTIRFWSEARTGFFTYLAGWAILTGAIVLTPDLQTHFVKELADRGIKLPLPDNDSAEKPKELDLTAEIAAHRSRLEALEASFAEDGAVLMKQYADLDRQRKALAPNDTAAIEKFNVAAATYSASTTRRKQMQQDIATAHTELDKLLDARSRAQAAIRPAASKRVVMYTTSTCPACKMAKQYLAQKGVPYEEIDVQQSAPGREAFQRLGGRGVPLIMVGDQRMEGFNSQQFDRMMGS